MTEKRTEDVRKKFAEYDTVSITLSGSAHVCVTLETLLCISKFFGIEVSHVHLYLSLHRELIFTIVRLVHQLFLCRSFNVCSVIQFQFA